MSVSKSCLNRKKYVSVVTHSDCVCLLNGWGGSLCRLLRARWHGDAGSVWQVPTDPSLCLRFASPCQQESYRHQKPVASIQDELRGVLGLHVSGCQILKAARCAVSVRELSRVPGIWAQQEPQVRARHIGERGSMFCLSLRDQSALPNWPGLSHTPCSQVEDSQE